MVGGMFTYRPSLPLPFPDLLRSPVTVTREAEERLMGPRMISEMAAELLITWLHYFNGDKYTMSRESVTLSQVSKIAVPKAQDIRVIGFEYAIHDRPVNVGSVSIERYLQMFANAATSPIPAHQVFGVDKPFLSSFEVPQRRLHRVGRVLVYLKPIDYCTSFNQRFVPQEISDVYFLHLSLSDNVDAAVSRVTLRAQPWNIFVPSLNRTVEFRIGPSS